MMSYKYFIPILHEVHGLLLTCHAYVVFARRVVSVSLGGVVIARVLTGLEGPFMATFIGDATTGPLRCGAVPERAADMHPFLATMRH